MKYTLKNRPSHRGFAFGEDSKKDFGYARDCIVWFEGFEKRQRQNLADYEKALETQKNWDKEFLACWKAISNYIKLEVLGVEPKSKEETKR